MNRLSAKRKDFYTQIRRQQINQKISQIRKAASYDFITLQELLNYFGLAEKSERDCTLLDLLIQKKHVLLKVPLGEIEEENTERLPLDVHIRFWKHYSQQLYNDKTKYDLRLGDILLEIVSKYSYSQVHYSTFYELHILNMLQLVAANLTLKQRERVIDWVAGAQGLRVISACIENDQFQFFKYKFYPNLYKVIEIGLKSDLKSESDQATQILQKILSKADWDDTFELYQSAQGLMIYLCTKIERYYKDTVLKNYNLSVLLLLDTYDEAVLDYARGTVAYAAALLVISPIPQNYTGGLLILQALTQIDSKKIVTFLLCNKQIRDVGLWSKLCRQTIFPRHSKPDVRCSYLSIFHNMLALGQQAQLQNISCLFCQNYQNIFQMFAEILDSSTENEINIQLVLNSLLSFLFYGRVQEQPHILLQVFQMNGLCKQILALVNRQEGQISQTCSNILAILHNNGPNL